MRRSRFTWRRRFALGPSVGEQAGKSTGLTLCSPRGCELQQFSAPDCFIEKGAWEGGSRACTAKDLDAWFADLTHWRAERKIRIGYSDQRYHDLNSSGPSPPLSSHR